MPSAKRHPPICKNSVLKRQSDSFNQATIRSRKSCSRSAMRTFAHFAACFMHSRIYLRRLTAANMALKRRRLFLRGAGPHDTDDDRLQSPASDDELVCSRGERTDEVYRTR